MNKMKANRKSRQNSHPKVHSQGYSLVELMFVLLVVGILALAAIPSFLQQTVRSQILDAMPLADIAKAPVAAAWSLGQPLPADNAAAGLPAEHRVVNNAIRAVAVQDGAIHITFGNSANRLIRGKQLSLRPAVVENTPIVPVSWVCGLATGPGEMDVRGVNRTDIPVEYLPRACRATGND